MGAKKRCLMVRAGPKAGNWIRNRAPKVPELVEVVGLIDLNGMSLIPADQALKVPPDRLFTDMAAGFAAVDADFCTISVPPAFQKDAALLAIQQGMAILCDKPLGDDWQACVDIYSAVQNAGLKMATILYFHQQPVMQTVLSVLREGNLGRVNYIVCRFGRDCREYGSWGSTFRHEIPHALLLDGAAHHFELLRLFSGADCRTISGWEWNPPWSTSKGAFCCLYVMEMTNGVRVSYEANNVAAGEQNSWQKEYLRVECENGAVAVGQDHIVRTYRYKLGGSLITQEVPIVTLPREGHDWLLHDFLDWLDGGPPSGTAIDNNIQTEAMVFAAIEASLSGQVVDVQAMVKAIM